MDGGQLQGQFHNYKTGHVDKFLDMSVVSMTPDTGRHNDVLIAVFYTTYYITSILESRIVMNL